jgi:hypothetical protein
MAPNQSSADVVVPVSCRDDDERRETVRLFVDLRIGENLNAWHDQVKAGLDLAAPPAKPESRFYWYVALAGNLIWAATCLINPVVAVEIGATELLAADAGMRVLAKEEIALAAEIKTKLTKMRADNSNKVRSFVSKSMNFGGAAVGSGGIEAAVSSSTPPGPEDGKKILLDAIDEHWADLEDDYSENMLDVWTDQLVEIWKQAGGQVKKPLGLFDRALWALMFPSFPFTKDRYKLIRFEAKRVIESALADYNRQWLKWERDRSMPHGHQAYASWAMGTMAIPSFRPKLLFHID